MPSNGDRAQRTGYSRAWRRAPSWFGERKLAPGRAAVDELVDATVASGLAAYVHARHFELLGYSHLLEREVHEQGSDNERLLHERDAARLHLDALVTERGHLKAHADNLARDRESLRAGVERFEPWALGLVEDRTRVIADARALEAEVRRLARVVERLRDAGESARMQRHAFAAEDGALRTHAEILTRERRALALHAATLESEREQLVRHAANLERILDRTRAWAVHRSLSNLKNFLVRPRPRAPFAYVPPWVADGSRPDGATPANLEE